MKCLLSLFFVISPLLLLAAADPNLAELEHAPMDMSPLFFIIISLFIGINAKRFLRKIPIPYTVILLIIGVFLGALNRYDWFGDIKLVTNALDWASHIGPEIILYVFLPTLIFEAAFDLDVHTFKKSFVLCSNFHRLHMWKFCICKFNFIRTSFVEKIYSPTYYYKSNKDSPHPKFYC